MNGLIELLAVLLSLGDFGAAPNSKAPAPAEVLKYAPDSYDLMLYADVEVVLPKNYDALSKLPDKPAIKENAKLAEEVRSVLREAETGRQGFVTMAGFDPIKDIQSVAVFAQIHSANEMPDFLVVVRGKIPVDKIKGLVAMGAPGNVTAGKGDKGELLLGTKAWIEAREAKDWKAKKPDARAVDVLKKKPLFAMTATFSEQARNALASQMGPKANVLTDMLGGHDFASFHITHNGGGWSWVAKDKAGLERAALASAGVIDLMRAGHYGSRGMAQVVLAAIDSYKEQIPEVAELTKHRDELLGVVNALTGDGKFKATVSKQAGTNTLSVQLSGKTLSDVFPVAGAMFLGGIGAFVMAGHGAEPPTVTAVEAPHVPVPVGGGNRRVRVRETYKAARGRHAM